MKRILAIARLTFKAAYRFRLVWVLAVLLLIAVAVMPMFLKDVGKPQFFSQLLLTYTLTAVTGLLGFATLWLACGTLARDVEECQIQMVAVKPVARWQIWMGKWLGIMVLNLVLLVFSGAVIYGMLKYRASKLPAEQQEALRNEVFVARGSVKPTVPDFEPIVEKLFAERINKSTATTLDREFIRKQVQAQVKQEFEVVKAGYAQKWKVNLGLAKVLAKDKPLFIRAKFTVTTKSPSGTYPVLWRVGVPDSPKVWTDEQSLSAETFHQFPIPPNLFDDNGNITIDVGNVSETDMLFQIEDGIEVLYPESNFTLNYVRGLSIIFLWIGLLAAIGLAAASILSFPVAAFFSLGILIIVFSSGTISQVLEEGTVWEVNHETGVADSKAPVDYIALPVFRALSFTINMVRQFSPIDSLSTGRSITWAELGRAIFQICFIMSGAFALLGMVLLTRRELATPQGTQ